MSFLAGVLGNGDAEVKAKEGKHNSQNIPLPEPTLNPKLAMGGGSISIIDGSALEYQAEISGDSYVNDQISTYIVRENDTLSQIAKMFGVSINTIIWANDIKSGIITPGQNLVILPVSGVRHIVKNGDTLQSIAKEHRGDINEILQFNNLETDAKLAIGDVVIVPNVDALVKTITAPSSGGKTLSGYFARPLAGGRRTQGIHGYNGVDIAAPVGTTVYASAGGKVIVSKGSGYNGGYGNYVVISHPNGTQTLYAHLDSTLVVQGVTVTQGQAIGTVGNTGRSTGAHLHFEVRGAKNPL